MSETKSLTDAKSMRVTELISSVSPGLGLDDVDAEMEGERSMSGWLVDSETGEVIISETWWEYNGVEIADEQFIIATRPCEGALYTTEGEHLIDLPWGDLERARKTTIVGREFLVLEAGREHALVNLDTEEAATEFHENLILDGTTVIAPDEFSRVDKEYELNPDPIWAMERDLEQEDEVLPPEVTEEVKQVCEEYVEDDMGWVLDLEADLEDAMA